MGYDYLGFGRSEGTRGLIEDKEEFYQDGVRFVQLVRKYYAGKMPEECDLKYYAYGYSLGGQ